MSDIDIAKRATRQIETLLEQRFQAEGLNLHERLATAQRHLPDRIIHQALCVALVRDDILMNPDLVIKDRKAFEFAAREVIDFLSTAQKTVVIPPLKTRRRRGFIAETATLMATVAGASLLFFAIGAAIWTNRDDLMDKSASVAVEKVALPQIGR
jgi:hypothetical protein